MLDFHQRIMGRQWRGQQSVAHAVIEGSKWTALAENDASVRQNCHQVDSERSFPSLILAIQLHTVLLVLYSTIVQAMRTSSFGVLLCKLWDEHI